MADESKNLRSYEISIWTLQDRFISILKWATVESKGQIQDPEFTKSDDGTRELSFSIPKFYYYNGQKMLNPMWHQLEDQPLDANMHKLKIIFNKNTKDEAVEEMFITSVTMTHSGDMAMIEVKAEGMAFHELGKIGYKIELDPQIYYDAVEDWFESGAAEGEKPINNIEYWNNIVFGGNLNRLLKKLKNGVPLMEVLDLVKNFAQFGITIEVNELSTSSDGLKYLDTSRPTISAMNIDDFYRTNWTYEVQMDWSSFSRAFERESDIVYEDEYVSSWETTNDGTGLIPRANEAFKEKYRNVQIKESNIYNITQTIAETFGVFCRYEYVYDDRYQIIGRKVVYYNNYLMDSKGHLSLTYPYSTTEIRRTIDNTDTITKMFVKMVDSNADDSNITSIMSVEAHRSMEDYLLNFDYLKETNNLTEAQIEAIPKFEALMRTYNLELTSLAERIHAIENEINELKAKQTTYKNGKDLAQEQYDNAQASLRALTGNVGAVIVDGYNAKVCVLTTENGQAGRKITFPFEGVDPATVKLYTSINYTGDPFANATQVVGGVVITDDYGNAVGLRNLVVDANINIVYLTCAYSPKLHWERISNAWARRMAEDQRLYDEISEKLNGYSVQLDGSESTIYRVAKCSNSADDNHPEDDIDAGKVDECLVAGPNYGEGVPDTNFGIGLTQAGTQLNVRYKTLLETKQRVIERFERLMGPALREGYWQPEDYDDYGDIYNDSVCIRGKGTAEPNPEKPYIDEGNSPYLSFIWDETLYDEETPVIYQASIDGKMEQHLIVDLRNCLDEVQKHIDDLSFVFYNKNTVEIIDEIIAKGDYTQSVIDKLNNTTRMQSYKLGAGCELGYINQYTTTGVLEQTGIPVLIITGATELPDSQIEFMTSQANTHGQYAPFLGCLKTTQVGASLNIEYEKYVDVTFAIGLNGLNIRTALNYTPETYVLRRAMPRLFINSLKLKSNGEDVKINYNGSLLKIYDDFSVIADERYVNDVVSSGYYITPKAETIFGSWTGEWNATNTNIFTIQYVLSNMDISIYLDAYQIMRENAYPKVTYEVTLSMLDPQFIHTAYNQLNHVVHINDNDLQLENVYGYISSMTLKLDREWEDEITVKNYETKFEDLFSTIVAQTEAMKKNSELVNSTLQAFAPNGSIKEETLKQSMRRADLNYSFYQGKLTIDDENGIWGTSDAGVVAFRGGGIFTAYEKDSDDNWIWNTGILPTGIDANLITTGQLDTNKIKVYAGDQLRFQLNGEGLFAYKNGFADVEYLIEMGSSNPQNIPAIQYLSNLTDVNDYNQYVRFYENGLFLVAEKGAKYIKIENNDIANASYDTLTKTVNRVEISWQGLILRNWKGERVFYADPNTGNLTLSGRIETSSGHIGGWEIGTTILKSNNINLISTTTPDSQSGIFLTNAASALQTITYNNETYYAYTYNGQIYYANKLSTSGLSYPYSSGTKIIAYRSTLTAVSPKYVYVLQSSSEDSSAGVEHAAYGTIGAEVKDDGSLRYEDQPYTDEGSVAVTTTTKTIIVDSAGSTTALQYNGVDIEYDYTTSPSASWYTKMQSAGYDSLVDKGYSNQLVDVTSEHVTLSILNFTPTFSLWAETGKVSMNNGQLGSFNFDNVSLRDGKLSNTELSIDNYIKINNTSIPLSTYGNCFCDFSSNSALGTFTLTRINGTVVNFNIASLAAYQNARKAAGTIECVEVKHNNAFCSVTVRSGYGTVATYTVNITDVYENGKNNGAITDTAVDSGDAPPDSSSSGCNVNCAGECRSSCGATCDEKCKGCTATCRSGCGNDCTNGCKDSCGTTCNLGCSIGCKTGCTSSCSDDCYGGCTGTCSGSCEGKCSSTCTGTCKGKVGGGCFSGDMRILTGKCDWKNIENIHVGDIVMSYNVITKQFIPQVITKSYKHEYTPRLIKVTLSNNTVLKLTPGHPLLTTEGWKSRDIENSLIEHNTKATWLEIGDTLIGYTNNPAIQNIEEVDIPENYTTYNAEVDTYHTFVVEGIVAHNAKSEQ